jgi:ATP synthase protein I
MPGERTPWRQVGILVGLGLTLVAATAIGVALGILVDRWLGSSPWGLVLGLLLGVTAGFRQVLRDIWRATGT